MTAAEIFNAVTHGGGNDFAEVVGLLEEKGSAWCLIGGLAINAYVEPVYTVDADFVLVAAALPRMLSVLEERGYRTSQHRFWANARRAGSDLAVQFTTDERYQGFCQRAVPAEVLGVLAKVAALADLFQGKLWAWADPERRSTKRAKDELDLLRIAERFGEYVALLPEQLRSKLA